MVAVQGNRESANPVVRGRLAGGESGGASPRFQPSDVSQTASVLS